MTHWRIEAWESIEVNSVDRTTETSGSLSGNSVDETTELQPTDPEAIQQLQLTNDDAFPVTAFLNISFSHHVGRNHPLQESRQGIRRLCASRLSQANGRCHIPAHAEPPSRVAPARRRHETPYFGRVNIMTRQGFIDFET